MSHGRGGGSWALLLALAPSATAPDMSSTDGQVPSGGRPVFLGGGMPWHWIHGTRTRQRARREVWCPKAGMMLPVGRSILLDGAMSQAEWS